MGNTLLDRVVVTGGAGFIGSTFVAALLDEASVGAVLTLDALTYAGNLANLADALQNPRHRFVRASIGDREAVSRELDAFRPTAIVNFAAETHVDRSILEPAAFVETNVLGTQVLLEAARALGEVCFLHVSTDEVYGSVPAPESRRESDRLDPTSPYAASKAASDLLVLAYHKTYGLDVRITRCSNNYGPRQFPEKLIPLMIANALDDRPLPVYGDGHQLRSWLHVSDHCRAIRLVLERGEPGAIYNVDAGEERTNLEVVEALVDQLGKPRSLIRHVTDRPAHDRRYAVDASRIRKLGWSPSLAFGEGLRTTVDWYRANRAWVEAVRDASYRRFYERWYGSADSE